jgi:hypothetical protein
MPKKIELLDFGCGDLPYRLLFISLIDEYLGADILNSNKMIIIRFKLIQLLVVLL